jgi:myosin heavy subunit
MSAVEVSNANKAASLRLIAAILILGNVKFDPRDGDSGEEAVLSKDSLPLIDTVTTLLGIHDECCASGGVTMNSLGKALCERVRHLPGGEVVIGFNTVLQAEESRDALSKAIYCKLFDWIVENVNNAIAGPQEGSTSELKRRQSISSPSNINKRTNSTDGPQQQHGKRVGNIGTVGVLDIFGFEDMQTNGLEQLLINAANETLQGVFNAAIFAAEEAVVNIIYMSCVCVYI